MSKINLRTKDNVEIVLEKQFAQGVLKELDGCVDIPFQSIETKLLVHYLETGEINPNGLDEEKQLLMIADWACIDFLIDSIFKLWVTRGVNIQSWISMIEHFSPEIKKNIGENEFMSLMQDLLTFDRKYFLDM
jgi:hypothetical protein